MTTVATEYRRARERQWEGLRRGYQYMHPVGFAATALRLAREEVALQKAEAEERIRFEWLPDDEYSSEDMWGLDDPAEQAQVVAEERAKLESGEWVVEGCIAYVPTYPKTCPHCGGVLGDSGVMDWDSAASLWGIVHEPGDEYTREVERELAAEAGVI